MSISNRLHVDFTYRQRANRGRKTLHLFEIEVNETLMCSRTQPHAGANTTEEEEEENLSHNGDI